MKVRLPQGMGGGPSNMQSMIKQAQKMQEDMAAKQAELEAREYDISAGGGAVKIKITGKLEVENIEIDPEIVAAADQPVPFRQKRGFKLMLIAAVLAFVLLLTPIAGAFALMAAGGDLGASIAPQLMGIVVDRITVSRFALDLSSRFAITPCNILFILTKNKQ